MNSRLKLLIVIVFSALTTAAFGQDFEWVRTYTGSELPNSDDPTNDIKGSFVDAQGNIYIVGNISSNGRIMGVDLLPQGVWNGGLSQSTVIAKISPEGQLVWHKAVYNTVGSTIAYSLCRMGDTAFMVMLCFNNINADYFTTNDYMYYFDTLLTSSDSEYFSSMDSSKSMYGVTNFVTFDLDGNILEQHIVEVGYIDSSGRTITSGVQRPWYPVRPNAMCARGISYETFAVDHDGNIYVGRLANDRQHISPTPDSVYTISISDGSISALKIIVDGRRSFVYPLAQRSPTWNYQILKFSPHFGSLLGGVYLYDTPYTDTTVVWSKLFSLDVDRNNNLYVSFGYAGLPSRQMLIANSDSLFVTCATQGIDGFMVVYNPDLWATDVIQPITIQDDWAGVGLGSQMGNACYFDYETNSLFVRGSGFNHSGLPVIFYRGDTIYFTGNAAAFWLRLDIDSHDLLSYGFTRQVHKDIKQGVASFAAKNNRVFSEVRFWMLPFADTLMTSLNDGLAFAIWDYDGHELQIENHNVADHKNRVGIMHLLDSVVYLTGTMNEDATFGSILLRNHGNSEAYVARYVDTSLMRPYVWHETREPQAIEWQQECEVRLADRAVPLTARATSGLPVRYVSLNRAVAYVNGDSLHFVSLGTATVTALQEGDRQYQPAQRVTKLFTVKDGEGEGIGREERGDSGGGMTVYPNPTDGTLHIESPDGGLEGGVVSLMSTQGRYESVPLRQRSGTHIVADLSHLAAGLYYLQVATPTKVYTEKVVRVR